MKVRMKTPSRPVLLELVVIVVAVEDEEVDEEKIEVEEMVMIFVAEEGNPVESSRKEENLTQNVSFVMETMLRQSAGT